MVARLQKMYPHVNSSDAMSILKSVNYSVELAAESLHKLHQADPTDVSASSSRSLGKKRSYDCLDESTACSSTDPLTHWADKFVNSLQGCPSMDEARSRTRQALEAFEQEIIAKHQIQNGSSEVSDKRLQELQQANLILYRRVSDTSAKNKELSEKAAESEGLQNALVEAQQKMQLLEQQNKHLQWVMQHAQGGSQPYNPFNGHGPPSIF